MHILIVDDSDELADIYSMYLKDFGVIHRVDRVEKVSDAFNETEFGMIILTYDPFLSESRARETLATVESIKAMYPETHILLFCIYEEMRPDLCSADTICIRGQNPTFLSEIARSVANKKKDI